MLPYAMSSRLPPIFSELYTRDGRIIDKRSTLNAFIDGF